MAISEREDWQNDLLPEIPHLGLTAPRRGDRFPLGAHQHLGCWELCLVAEGAVDWWVGDAVHSIRDGEAYITQPNEIHGGLHGQLGRCVLYWLQLRPLRGSLPGLGAAGKTLLQQLTALPRTWPAASSSSSWNRLLDEYRRGSAAQPLAARAALHCLLIDLLRAAQQQPQQAHPAIARATAAGLRRLGEGIGVIGLARAAGLSPAQFHVVFRQQVGCTPADWLRRQRMGQAKALLLRGTPVTQVALDVGYATSQHFATVFRQYTGVAPSQWCEGLGRFTT